MESNNQYRDQHCEVHQNKKFDLGHYIRSPYIKDNKGGLSLVVRCVRGEESFQIPGHT